jgi:Nif-specific regulatory protein
LKQTRRKLDQLEEQFELTSEMVGHSRAIAQVKQAIERAAPSAATVLIRGESGVGKELVARAVHRQSKRRQGPFVCLNCAALAPTLLESELFGHEKGAFTGATDRKIGKFEAADGGTLLLDEIGEMIPELQAKFLRVLEGEPFERLGGNKPIRTDVRVIAATNRNLEEAIAAKQFRADLYFRLRVIEIEIPPLRDRLQDVPELVEHFLKLMKQHAARKIVGVEPQALELMCRYHWPGNIRELRNVIERAVVLGADATINIDDLSLSPLAPPVTAKPQPTPVAEPVRFGGGSASSHAFEPLPLADVERAHIQAVLEHVGGNKSKASQLLGIERSTLDRKLKKYEEGDAVPMQ